MNMSPREAERLQQRSDDEAIFDLLLTTAHRLSIEVEWALGFEHVSVMGLLAMRRVAAARSSVTLRELAAMLGSSRASATEVVDRLVRDEHVERVVNPDDRRSRLLELTKLGTGVLEDARDAVASCMASITRNFESEEKASLRRDLARFERAADWHRTERLWSVHRIGGPGPRTRRPAPHVR